MITRRRYNVYGYRFSFETSDSTAAGLIDELYSPYSAAEGEGHADRYVLMPPRSFGNPGRRWRLSAPISPDREVTLLSSALQKIEAIICNQIVRQPEGYHPIHAALLRGPKGTLLISGCSGAGKTTLTLALHSRGLQAASDDATLLSGSDNLLHAVPRCFHLDACSAQLLQADGLNIPRQFFRHGFITPRDFNSSPAAPARARFVFFLGPERMNSPRLIPMSQAEMAAALLNETARGRATPLEGMTAIAALVSSCQCFAVGSGTLTDTADLVAGVVST